MAIVICSLTVAELAHGIYRADRVDSALEEKDRQIAALSERIRKLEEGRTGN